MNERWRVALAGLVAALAIPFLIIDSPAPAGGVETDDEEASLDVVEPSPDADVIEVELAAGVEPPAAAVEIVVTTAEVSPDISRLADQAGTWGLARAQAIEDGRVDATFTPPPSNTDYSLLPVVNTAPEPADATEDVVDESAPPEDIPSEETPSEETPTEPEPDDGGGGEGAPDPTEPESGDPETSEPEGEGVDPEPDPTPESPVVDRPAPAQVDGRVPPPPGGPTAGQWDALRRCESTHNYAAISPSGLYRGAYQFSQQTWDWVAGIHYPYLVGVDPIDAEPGWQDIMAYTLYAMRGWDQWPICGKNLL